MVRNDAGATQARTKFVSDNYFRVLGATLRAGRSFLPDEDRTSGAVAVAVISYGFWRRTFGGDPAAVGSTLRLNGQPFTIVGVPLGASAGSAPWRCHPTSGSRST